MANISGDKYLGEAKPVYSVDQSDTFTGLGPDELQPSERSGCGAPAQLLAGPSSMSR